MRRARIARFAPALAVLLVSAGARAEDEPAAAAARVELGDLRVHPAAVGPRLYAPSDGAFPGFDASEIPADALLAKFQEPPYPQHAFSLDLVEDLVKRLAPEATAGTGSVRLSGEALDVWASPAGAERVRAAARAVVSRLAPRLAVSAVLTDGGVLVAAGGGALVPRRWTALWFRRDVRRVVVGFEPQIASEAVSNQPAVTALPEGSELYVRWSPGERVSIVEAWLGSLEGAGETEVDLSAIRNVPEANSMGTARLPRTAVRRAATAVPVPAGEASEAVLSFSGAGKPLVLRLAFAAEPARDASDVPSAGGVFGVLRVAALAAPLEAGARASKMDETVRRLQALDARAAVEGRGPEAYGQAFLGVEGPAARLARHREAVGTDEERLARATLDLRVVPIAADALASALAAGGLAVGRVAAPEAVPAGEPASAVRLPVTSGVLSTVRSGTSVTGFAELPVAIADRTGALAAVPVGRFDGVGASVRATRGEDGSWDLWVECEVSWAQADGAKATLAFRAPLAMAYRTYNPNPEDASVRRVEVPLLTEGASVVQTSVRVAAGDAAAGRPVLLAVVSLRAAGGASRPALLLASLSR